jgi:hypothetical protein
MAIDQFIPEIWAAGVTQSFIANQVVIPTLRTQYTDAVAPGNKVHIINATTPTIVDYAGASRVINPEALADTEVNLDIDQEKAFSVNVDDVDKVQAGNGFQAWVDSAGKALAEDAENYLVDLMVAGGTDGNPDDVELDTAAKAKTAVRDIRRLMANAKVPTGNRYLVVNPDFTDLLIQALDDSSIAGTDDTLRNGVIGRLYGFTVIESPLLSVAGTPAAMGYHQDMVAYVNQIQSLEALRSQSKFADIVRGLNVYGAKVVKTAAVVQYVSVAA